MITAQTHAWTCEGLLLSHSYLLSGILRRVSLPQSGLLPYVTQLETIVYSKKELFLDLEASRTASILCMAVFSYFLASLISTLGTLGTAALPFPSPPEKALSAASLSTTPAA